MFRITHGQHAGQTCHTEDEALAMLTPEDLAAGGYVAVGEVPHDDSAPQNSLGYFAPVNPDGFASMLNKVGRHS